MPKEKVYGIADKAWQCVVGCDPHMPCAPRCWARKTVARVVECQKAQHPDRAEFFQVALTPDGKQWSGKTFLDEAHLTDPLKWQKHALIATGFHGDIGRLEYADVRKVLAIIRQAHRHDFMLLTKVPGEVGILLSGWSVLPNASIGCSVMNQSKANKMLPYMAVISAIGWRTHVWYEPAISAVDWTGWEFIEQLIVGGESGPGARRFRARWAEDSLGWCRENRIAFWMKQGGSDPSWGTLPGDPKAKEMASLPGYLRVREMPEARA